MLNVLLQTQKDIGKLYTSTS